MIVAVSAGLPEALSAQDVVTTIPGQPACGTCTIVTDSLFALGGPSDTIRVIGIRNIERDSRGRFYGIAETYQTVLVFDERGDLFRIIGRKGSGPGEFARPISNIRLGAGDTLFVAAGRELSVFDPSGRFIRRFVLMGDVFTFYPLLNGGFVAGMRLLTRDGVGLPLHILEADGTVRRSFGREIPAGGRRGPGGSSAPTRVTPQTAFVLANDKGSLWAPLADYAIERWFLDDRPPQRFVVKVPWLKPGERSETDSIRTERGWKWYVTKKSAAASFSGIDASGLLWYTGLIPVPGSRGTPDKRPETTILKEVVDPTGRRLLVSISGGKELALISGTDLACSWDETPDGEVTISVWRIGIRQR